MKSPFIIFCKKSDTIRMMPANYLVAVRVGRRWLADIDKAIDDTTSTELFLTIRMYANTYSEDQMRMVIHSLNSAIGVTEKYPADTPQQVEDRRRRNAPTLG